MTTALYYFSGTGNSLSVAQSINKHIAESELIPIVGSLKNKPIHISAERVGIIFPIHFMTVPDIVQDFLKEACFLNTEYVFVVVTGANPMYGNAIYAVKKNLKRAGVKLNAGFFIPMVAAHFPHIKLVKDKQSDTIYQDAKKKVLQVIEDISQLNNKFDNEISLLGSLNQILSKERKGEHQYFSIDKGCIRCGYCMQVCPFQNIRLHGKQVQWLDNCHRCFACLHFCSKSVIQYKKQSVGKPRIHHPSITLNDIALQRDANIS